VKKKKTPAPKRAGTATTQMTLEKLLLWTRLGSRLMEVAPEKFEEIIEALEQTVDARETIARFDWQLWTGRRPNKIYEA
jgi:hypothetical protein